MPNYVFRGINLVLLKKMISRELKKEPRSISITGVDEGMITLSFDKRLSDKDLERIEFVLGGMGFALERIDFSHPKRTRSEPSYRDLV